MLWHGCWLGGPHWGPRRGTVMCKEAEGEQGCMVQVVTSSFSRLDVAVLVSPALWKFGDLQSRRSPLQMQLAKGWL